MSTPVHVEHCQDVMGAYEVRWMINPPPKDVFYRVLEESWNRGESVRTIWRFEVIRAHGCGLSGDA